MDSNFDFDVDDFFSGYPAFFITSRDDWSDFIALILDDTKGDIID